MTFCVIKRHTKTFAQTFIIFLYTVIQKKKTFQILFLLTLVIILFWVKTLQEYIWLFQQASTFHTLKTRCPFHQHLTSSFFYKTKLCSFSLFTVLGFVIFRGNVTKSWLNFINILWALFCRCPFAKKLQSQTVAREKLLKALLYKKQTCKMLMKLTQVKKYFAQLFST